MINNFYLPYPEYLKSIIFKMIKEGDKVKNKLKQKHHLSKPQIGSQTAPEKVILKTATLTVIL